MDERPDSEIALVEAVRYYFGTRGIRNVAVVLLLWTIVSKLFTEEIRAAVEAGKLSEEEPEES